MTEIYYYIGSLASSAKYSKLDPLDLSRLAAIEREKNTTVCGIFEKLTKILLVNEEIKIDVCKILRF